MNTCLGLGLVFLFVGAICLSIVFTATGRKFDRVYLKMFFPRPGPNLVAFRGLSLAVIAFIFPLAGAWLLVKAAYAWWTGRSCD
jgi:hypothetical protein